MVEENTGSKSSLETDHMVMGSVNDGNGITSNALLHNHFGSRAAVVVKVCLHLFSYTSLSDTQSYTQNGRCSCATYRQSSQRC
jgi:Na+/alanine symporter